MMFGRNWGGLRTSWMPSNVASEGKSGHSSRRPSSGSSVPAGGEIPFHCLLPTSAPLPWHAQRSKDRLFPHRELTSYRSRGGGDHDQGSCTCIRRAHVSGEQRTTIDTKLDWSL